MEHELELQVLDMQEAGIRLYADLSEFYCWLGDSKMSRALQDKAKAAVDDYIDTRCGFIEDYGKSIRHKPSLPGAAKPGLVKQLQWQEGTNEPEDRPNVSNGEDIMAKKSPTRQPWEKPAFMGMSGSAAPIGQTENDNLYYAGLGCWLAYEQALADLYGKLYEQTGESFHMYLLTRAQDEIERIKDGLEEKEDGVYSCG